ncbi:hypothetical protein ACWCRF_37700, partial [Streptomyces sp. NPDC002405]
AEQLGGGYALSGWAERTAIESADAVAAVKSSSTDQHREKNTGIRDSGGRAGPERRFGGPPWG